MALVSLTKMVKEIQKKNGFCHFLPKHYATISTRRTCCSTGTETEEQTPYIIEDCPGTDRLLTGWSQVQSLHEAFPAMGLC